MRTQRMTKAAAVLLILGLAGSATADWVTSGNNMYSGVTGNVGIGTTAPNTRLELYGSDDMGNALSWNRASVRRWSSFVDSSGKWHLYDASVGDRMIVDTLGNFGIGTQSPAAKLDVWSSYGDVLLLRNSGVGSRFLSEGVHSSGYARIGTFNPSTGVGFNLVLQDVGGNVGIGTSSPSAKLDVNGDVKANGVKWWTKYGMLTSDQGGSIELGGEGTPYIDFHKDMSSDFDARIKLVDSWLVMQTDGVAICDVVTGEDIIRLGKGMDYAEGFDVSDKDNAAPGTVLRIDPEHPGQLAVSKEAYDKGVAGIVAGAKGLGSGVRLGSSEFAADVALAGRVYCNVDATESAVEPCDLLTTSSTPGYAMKAVDQTRSQGAILGKAMQKLDKGQKGQILVLVTLQ
jgi:hypothetical protein